MTDYFNNFGSGLGSGDLIQMFGPLFFLLIIWSLFWKGLALWHAGRKGQPGWFVVLLVINTSGILEIIYLFLVRKIKLNQLFKK